ncbi:MAG: papain-like cysteine protease family protein [Gemmatimonadota bacterium]
MRPGTRLVLRLSALSGLIAGIPQALLAQSRGAPAVLQVPYLAQSELLCGGAAVAMVERWWGKRGVSPEEFGALVRPSEGGIRTDELVATTASRGWQTQAIAGTPDAVMQSLRDSIPVIALIQVGRNRFHYVVVVGWSDSRVVYHDPAVAPFASVAIETFLKRWNGADRWALLIRPPPVAAVVPSHLPPITVDSLPCRPWLDAAVTEAGENQLVRADSLLGKARQACPGEALVLRELAGVRFRQGLYPEAVNIAQAYLAQVPTDTLGWQLLASSRYLAGDRDGALAAWNHIGRLTVDFVNVVGVRRIRFTVFADAIGIRAGGLLTMENRGVAERRLRDIPAVGIGSVRYAPVSGGVAEVQAAVVERPIIDPPRRLILMNAISALSFREVDLAVASPFRAGELWSGQWRWDAGHPRLALRVELPAKVGIPAVLSVEESREEYRFTEVAPDSGIPRQRRRATTVGIAGWLSPHLELMSAIRYERWVEADYVAVALGGAVHSARDRVVMSLQGEQAAPLRQQPAYQRVQARLSWKAPRGPASIELAARAGGDWASADAPEGVWPLAGGNLTWAIPLRAHRMSPSERRPTQRLGRTILHGGLSIDRRVGRIGLAGLGVGAFVDAARVMSSPAGGSDRRDYLDAGAGIRIDLPGARLGALRVDLARSLLAEKRWGVSVGVEQPWPLRLRWMP